ncbi:MAG: glycosyltransferase family 2 protein [Candidatus Marinarcus sp.]|uniref:glycosyltransferase family 2 protein n=1 Tax=Candidatus Marinarcus sp. TaxID=3100987 RepID=UPI003AFFF3A1
MRDKKPLISIIMNCYNSDQYLEEAINSIFFQTYKNWEIIFWDNQSVDRSAEIVKSYRDQRIKYFYAPTHTTLGEARNKALEKVNGEFISFLDCDDLYLSEKLEKTLNAFNENEIGLVYTNGYTLYNNENKKKVFYKEIQSTGDLFVDWLSSYQVMIPSVMFRKNVLNDLEYWFDTRFNMIEEFDFFIRISKKWKVNYCHENLCVWRAHVGSLTWTKKEFFEQENKQFLECIVIKYPEIANTISLNKFKAKIAYQEFYNTWNKKNKAERKLLIPYLFVEKRLILVYIFSFLNLNSFNKILKKLGKNV